MARDMVEGLMVEGSRELEEARNEVIRLPLRYRIALSMRKTGQESAFNDYVLEALGAWEFWDPQRNSSDGAVKRRHERLEADARRAFVAGDVASASRLLRERECKPDTPSCLTPVLGADSILLNWELKVGRLSAAARRLRETDWTTKSVHIDQAGQVARAFMDAGKPEEGLAILSELRPEQASEQALIAQIYWRLGEVAQSRSLMREAAQAALSDAKRDLPVSLAGQQLSIGDRDGAIDTLRRIQQLDPDRLATVRALLAGRLAFAGLDADARALLDGKMVDGAVLANIIVGQARRHDFDAAFRTLQELRKWPPARQEDNAGNSGYRSAITSIARNAARAGDADAFRRADAIRRELGSGRCVVVSSPERGTQVLHDDSDTRSLGALARAGKAGAALEHARALPDPSKRVEALGLIAEALAGLPDPHDDPFGFFDSC
jgi:tetratricopeptide (TPR) repeat protein